MGVIGDQRAEVEVAAMERTSFFIAFSIIPRRPNGDNGRRYEST